MLYCLLLIIWCRIASFHRMNINVYCYYVVYVALCTVHRVMCITKAQKAHTKFWIRNSRCEIRNTKFWIRNSKYEKHQPGSQSEPVLHRSPCHLVPHPTPGDSRGSSSTSRFIPGTLSHVADGGSIRIPLECVQPSLSRSSSLSRSIHSPEHHVIFHPSCSHHVSKVA